MARKSRPSSALQQELLRLLRPADRRLQEQPSERIRPRLAQIGDEYAGRPQENPSGRLRPRPAQRGDESPGRPAPETLPLLEGAVRSGGARPDMTALREFAEEIAEGTNPFA